MPLMLAVLLPMFLFFEPMSAATPMTPERLATLTFNQEAIAKTQEGYAQIMRLQR